jgi:hypothetical protein
MTVRIETRREQHGEEAPTYSLRPVPDGCDVDAHVSIHPPSGHFGRLIGRATGLLLAAGTLDAALQRIAREAERSAQTSARRHRT